MMNANPKTSGRSGERGSQTVEAGLITLMMFALIFLLMDISLSLFIKSTLQEAARDGVRFGVTEQLLTGDLYLSDSINKVVQQGPWGSFRIPDAK